MLSPQQKIKITQAHADYTLDNQRVPGREWWLEILDSEISKAVEETKREIADELHKRWRFNAAQFPESSWHDREDYIEELNRPEVTPE